MVALGDDGELAQRLIRILSAAAGRPPLAYRLDPDERDQGAFWLHSPEDVLEVEEAWSRVWSRSKPFSIQLPAGEESWDPREAEGWLAFLEGRPKALDSVSILDDLTLAVLERIGAGNRAVDETMILPLTARGQAILERTLEGHAEARLPWVALDNRPALRLLVVRSQALMRRGDTSGAIALMERLLALNPGDNHGLRTELVTRYLETGQEERVRSITAQLEGDLFAEVRYGRVLALWRLGRKGEALSSLAEAVRDLPLVPKYLLAEDPRPPKIHDLGVSIGGEDQAWLYRQDALDLWRATPGALEWLRASASGMARRRRLRPRPR
jgi:tetratricopeptide (TPR) repeat protein